MSSEKNLKWHFDPLGTGEVIGINDPTIMNFAGDPLEALSRESLQNIIDAGVKYPVRAEFNVLNIKASKIPGAKRYKEISALCIDYWEKKKNDECVRFFNNIFNTIDRDLYVSVLRISDYNTRGMTDSDYFNFFGSVGSTQKESGKGGSYGLGKGAYYYSSSFRTIFLSSNNKKEGYHFAGKAKIVTFSENDTLKQSSGIYGYEGCEVTRREMIPKLFQRKENGTDIYIVGFN